MIVSFIMGLIFGVGSGGFEKIVGEPIRKHLSLSDSELAILSFAGLMLVASIVVSAMSVDSSAFWLVLGGAIGAFAIRAVLFGKTKVEARRQQALEAAGDVVEEGTDAAKNLADNVAERVS